MVAIYPDTKIFRAAAAADKAAATNSAGAANDKGHIQITSTALVCGPLLEARILTARDRANNLTAMRIDASE